MKPIQNMGYKTLVRKPYSDGAIIRDGFPGFKEDYLVIHSILRKYKAKRLCEIGTSTGLGTKVICNAMGIRWWQIWKRFYSKSVPLVFSIDVPPGTDPTVIYPDGEDGHPFKAGAYNNLPYVQLYGDSNHYDFSLYYPIDAWFIDGKHNYEFAYKDTQQALKSKPNIIIWHDMQIEGVEKAVMACMNQKRVADIYSVYRVGKTRIGFATKL